MIAKIGVIHEDLNSIGFLRGLRHRLKCEAVLIDPPGPIGKSSRLTRRQAKLAWLYFQKKGVDLIVRFTDADRERWQVVRRGELEVFPKEARPILVCGVADKNVEHWLCLDEQYASKELGISRGELADFVQRTDRVKRAIVRLRESSEGPSDVVQRLVCDAPGDVFHLWLDDDALRSFYTDCRAAAKRADCETPNELEAA